ncbi:MAG: UDP-3-O-(3-hydroxymyristoyl)glucosamine N-acyltransferase [Ignavibacteriaceae bacterium]|nr:MAG: UDP-3-O-(3-hydroxymyristoyl)glucosamine N-acyltransferase [Chlorobiota bacterium]KXK06099.1 MAG: UDP-3-O-(3-hydroxymyristoyl) glucosamine N-acyltransferase [Chlorobi bacterium OLB4]MBV6398531.1 UDP-3-O-(3-hydroxymyristoyl)glucosamine N-acyltransferase [Ignavibacteria bacterium]MCC6885765.1 UDP-3-O-(3-hydroxymyristoyl)glucosamine N-acyltransferase [Ignavibacteriales bacterium]MCE7953040.1 UDP-3-O-(3-hydroxymyristoyl)glucosamine N-acyltransferase [Chlorobi bacterium CHB7]MDL1887122.1 UDP
MFTLSDIENLGLNDVEFLGDKTIKFNSIASISNSREDSITWIKLKNPDPSKHLNQTKAAVVVCGVEVEPTAEILQTKLIVRCIDPKSVFIRIAEKLFNRSGRFKGVHESAIIDAGAILGKDVFIGPNTVIGKSIIGDNAVIYGNCFIFENVRIGKNVKINPGVVIGADGFGYARNDAGKLEKFPHFGGVVIGDNVEIGANTCIDRGTLDDTVIEDGVKIDNLVHIAHNVRIGENSMVIANAMVGGSTKIGKNSWVAPSVSLMNGIDLSEGVIVGMGAVVTKSIPPNETWAGNPAKKLDEFIKIQNKLKSL